MLPLIEQRSAGWWGRPAHNLLRSFFKSKRLVANKGFGRCPMRYEDSQCGCNLAIYFGRSRTRIWLGLATIGSLFLPPALQQSLAAK